MSSLIHSHREKKTLFIRNRQRVRRVDARRLRSQVHTLLVDLLQVQRFELGIYLVSTREITRLNERYLAHTGATDVITFDYGDPAQSETVSGEIFICIQEAVRQARRFRTTWQTELIRYVVHGVLHLRGYDDQDRKSRLRMKCAEDRLLRKLLRNR